MTEVLDALLVSWLAFRQEHDFVQTGGPDSLQCETDVPSVDRVERSGIDSDASLFCGLTATHVSYFTSWNGL
jgi:hypothetical protein